MNRFLAVITRFIRDEEGQSLIEMALTLPILLMIVCAILDFGWLCANQLAVINCSREGARYGSINATVANATDKVRTRVLEVAPSYVRGSMSVSAVFSNVGSPRLGDVTVTVNARVEALTPVIGVLARGETINLSSVCTMKAE